MMIPLGETVNRRQYSNENKVVKNHIFTAEMEIVDFSHGRSSIKVVLQDAEGEYYGMFFSDFELLVKSASIENGKFTDSFHFEKRGGYYGIVPHLGRSF